MLLDYLMIIKGYNWHNPIVKTKLEKYLRDITDSSFSNMHHYPILFINRLHIKIYLPINQLWTGIKSKLVL